MNVGYGVRVPHTLDDIGSVLRTNPVFRPNGYLLRLIGVGIHAKSSAGLSLSHYSCETVCNSIQVFSRQTRDVNPSIKSDIDPEIGFQPFNLIDS